MYMKYVPVCLTFTLKTYTYSFSLTCFVQFLPLYCRISWECISFECIMYTMYIICRVCFAYLLYSKVWQKIMSVSYTKGVPFTSGGICGYCVSELGIEMAQLNIEYPLSIEMVLLWILYSLTWETSSVFDRILLKPTARYKY